MATEITMPKLSDTMTEGTLAAWRKNPGEWVERGDIIAEVETDKATMELECFDSGVLLEISVKAGETVPVGTVIARIGKAGEAAAPPPAEKTAHPETMETGVPPGEPIPVTPQTIRPPAAAPAEPPLAPMEKAAPMVRRLARERGIDLGLVKGTGPEGRITREDLDRYLSPREGESPGAGGLPGAAPAGGHELPLPSRPPPGADSETLTPMRAAITRTVSESWKSIPHFTVTEDVDMAAAEALHHGLTEAGHHVSLTDVVIKATATALAEFPRLNASFGDGRIIRHPTIDMGIAVDVENGLLVPVIRNCEVLSLREIGIRSRDLIGRARSGQIRIAEITGGTFTVSNMGMLGIKEFSAIILPPQAGILAIGAVADRPVIRNGVVGAARIMTMTLSADHRVVDGAYAARFMKKLAQTLENPLRLLV